MRNISSKLALTTVLVASGMATAFVPNSPTIHHGYNDVSASKILPMNLDTFIRIFFDILHEYLTSFTSAIWFSCFLDFNHSIDGRIEPHSKTCQFHNSRPQLGIYLHHGQAVRRTVLTHNQVFLRLQFLPMVEA